MLKLIDKFLAFFGLMRLRKHHNEIKIRRGAFRNLKNKEKKTQQRITELGQQLQKPDKEKLRKWSLRVREIGQCDCCTSIKNLTAHHLWDKKTHPSLMYQDENGVCLCSECHNNFHKMYTSRTHTTPAMYSIFKIRIQNGQW